VSRTTVAVAAVCSIVLAACAGTPTTVSPTATVATTPTTTPVPIATPVSDAAVVCQSLADLRKANDEDLVPMIQDMMSAGYDQVPALRKANNVARLGAIGLVVIRNASAIDKAVLPAAPELVVELKDAYRGIGLGAVALKNIADDPNGRSGQLNDAMSQLVDGRQHLDAAIHEAELAQAAGTVACAG
jgi:hypothetical protein